MFEKKEKTHRGGNTGRNARIFLILMVIYFCFRTKTGGKLSANFISVVLQRQRSRPLSLFIDCLFKKQVEHHLVPFLTVDEEFLGFDCWLDDRNFMKTSR